METGFNEKVLEYIVIRLEDEFDSFYHQYVDNMISDEIHQALCDERYQLLIKKQSELGIKEGNYTMSVDFFKKPSKVNKLAFGNFILCHAVANMIPEDQPVLASLIECFTFECNDYVVEKRDYVDAMNFRLPGSFEHGRRR